MSGSNSEGEFNLIEGERKTTVCHPYDEFGDPAEYGYDEDRFRQLRELARPRESEA